MTIELTEVVKKELVKERAGDIEEAIRDVSRFRWGNLITLEQWRFQRDRIGRTISEMCAQYPQLSVVVALKYRYNSVFRYNKIK